MRHVGLTSLSFFSNYSFYQQASLLNPHIAFCTFMCICLRSIIYFRCLLLFADTQKMVKFYSGASFGYSD